LPRPRRIESVFLNIPCETAFEDLYLAYFVDLTRVGLRISATLAVPNQGRLDAIIDLIEQSDFSAHDLSPIELSHGIPRFNMPVELGLALYRSRITRGRHRVFIFESRRYRAQRSASDIIGIAPQIHCGTPRGLMSGLCNIFRQSGDVNTVPEMLASYPAVRHKLPELRRNGGGRSLFEAAGFQDLTVAALVEPQTLVAIEDLPAGVQVLSCQVNLTAAVLTPTQSSGSHGYLLNNIAMFGGNARLQIDVMQLEALSTFLTSRELSVAAPSGGRKAQ
jgi:hypothetical protein